MDSNFGLNPSQERNGQQQHNDATNNQFLANILNTLPGYDPLQSSMQSKSNGGTNGNGLNGNSFMSNLLEPFQRPSITNSILSNFANFTIDDPSSLDFAFLGNNGNGNGNHGNGNGNTANRINSPSTSDSSNGSPRTTSCSNYSKCGHEAVNKCLNCTSVYCSDCINEHVINGHSVIAIAYQGPSPIGSAPSASAMMHHAANMHLGFAHENAPRCDAHSEFLSFICEDCHQCVCQQCTLTDHKDHRQKLISSITDEEARNKLTEILMSSKAGVKIIKQRIDSALLFTHILDKEAAEYTLRVKKSFRSFIQVIEERERELCDRIERFKQQRSTELNEQLIGLQGALSGTSDISVVLTNSLKRLESMSPIEKANLLTTAADKHGKLLRMCSRIKPQEYGFSLRLPSFELIQEIRAQSDVTHHLKDAMNGRNGTNGNGNGNSTPGPNISNGYQSMAASLLTRNEPRSSNTPSNGDNLVWTNPNSDATSTSSSTVSPLVTATRQSYASIVKPVATPSIAFGQAIPGWDKNPVKVRYSVAPILTFAYDGQEEGKVSRPWGVCVNKNNDIIIADRRNNRIQVFSADGTFKFKFGSKGSGSSQFDLPAGVATDRNCRIVVVDKDNHRVQVFSATGVFVNKFGSHGKENGQFQYPWAVATNTKNQILITDSRNHRIQLFSPDGHFITKFAFDGPAHSRYLKGVTTPRGVCFTPEGLIIVSDFENHRLLLIDSEMTRIISQKGHEGDGFTQFSRPSGVACDDEGKVIVADSKNQRILIFSPALDFLFCIDVRSSSHNMIPTSLEEKDRPSDIALTKDGRLVVLVEQSPESREVISPTKTFVQVY